MNKVILLFEHNNYNSVRILENYEHTFKTRFHVQVKGPNSKWNTIRKYTADSNHKHINYFNELCNAVEYVKINKD
jgi:hypothetical protein